MVAGIEIDGLADFQKAARRATDSDLPKRLGEANKRIGALVISKLEPKPDPAAVGEGAGATIRPSASKREVLLRVGGSHRPKPPMSVWGKRKVLRTGGRAPKRPFITETARRHQDEIGQAYLEAISQAMSGAFHKTEP